MDQVKITGLDIVRNPKQAPSGHMILANFSADIGVFHFKGCVFVRTNKGGFGAWLPRLNDTRMAGLKSVTLCDEAIRNALMQAAREAYIQMGGEGAEWTSRDNLHPHRGCDVDGYPTHPLHPNYTARDDRPGPLPEPDELPEAIRSMMVPVSKRVLHRNKVDQKDDA